MLGRGVSGVVEGEGGRGGSTVVAEEVVVEDAALALPGYVGHPDASDADAALVEALDEVLPEGLVELLGGMSVAGWGWIGESGGP
jgi:hypothetical protein